MDIQAFPKGLLLFRTNIKNWVSYLIQFIVSIVLFTNCASQKFVYPKARQNAKAMELILVPGIFETKTKQYKADYGTLVVPENRFKDDSRLIELPVIRIHSSSSNPTEPIFFLSGGPGKSNMTFTPPDYMLAKHDFVMVGYRGVDGSSILECPEVQNALKADGEVLSKKFLKNTGRAWTSCASRLKKEGVDLDGYTIMEVIEDMESARIALDYKRINLASGSYGTRVAYIYGLKHATSIYRSAMIGATPPGHFGWEPETIDRQLKYYADLWAKDSVMSVQTPDLLIYHEKSCP